MCAVEALTNIMIIGTVASTMLSIVHRELGVTRNPAKKYWAVVPP